MIRHIPTTHTLRQQLVATSSSCDLQNQGDKLCQRNRSNSDWCRMWCVERYDVVLESLGQRRSTLTLTMSSWKSQDDTAGYAPPPLEKPGAALLGVDPCKSIGAHVGSIVWVDRPNGRVINGPSTIGSACRYKNSPLSRCRGGTQRQMANLIFERVELKNLSITTCRVPTSMRWGIGHEKTDAHLCYPSVKRGDFAYLELNLVILTPRPRHKETLTNIYIYWILCLTQQNLWRFKVGEGEKNKKTKRVSEG